VLGGCGVVLAVLGSGLVAAWHTREAVIPYGCGERWQPGIVGPYGCGAVNACGGMVGCLGTIPRKGFFSALPDRTIAHCRLHILAEDCPLPEQRDARKGGGGDGGERGGANPCRGSL
jgi:hypothetical protein